MNNQNKFKRQNNNKIKSNYSSLRWLSKLSSQINSNRGHRRNTYRLDGLGDIELAKLHREANRPLRKIKEFNKDTKFCPCCSLPIAQKGYIEKFNFCDNTDKFSECGNGISLYFSYFRFSIIILILAFVTMGLPTFYFTYEYTWQLHNECNKIYDLDKAKVNETFPECSNILYFETINGISIYDNFWMATLNTYNTKKYKLLQSNIISSNENINGIMINFTIIYFISLIGLFIISIIYNILLFNQNKQYDLLITSPHDFTVIMTNLNLAFNLFFTKINQLNKEINKKKY
jgi:hypothetical protein